MERRLREYGATYYLLDTHATDGQQYRFYCRMASGNNSNVTRDFEATDPDALQAMAQVLRQVEAWRSGREPAMAPPARAAKRRPLERPRLAGVSR